VIRRGVIAFVLVLSVAGGTACAAANASDGVRTIHVTIRFSSFDPSAIDVAPGETVRFVVENADPIDHEFLIGDERLQQVHEDGTEAYHPPRPGEMSVPARTTQVTTYTFPAAQGSLIFGCHLPEHYAYGMRGTIAIG
jgi:uncharacterized cupredoxin-like copper-binding protein